MIETPPQSPLEKSAVLVGLESSGKSALFRALTGRSAPSEAGFAGSTYICKHGAALDGSCTIVDTPGVRFDADCAATRLALGALSAAHRVVLVLRGTEARSQLAILVSQLGRELEGRPLSILMTFEDYAGPGLPSFARELSEITGVPAAALNARRCSVWGVQRALAAIAEARPFALRAGALPEREERAARPSRIERTAAAPWLAAACVLIAYGLPVALAYAGSSALAEWIVEPILAQAARALAPVAPAGSLPWALLLGPYGVLSLGSYSFIWALPVVVLLGLSVSVLDQSGLKDRIMLALDPWMRPLGLEGRDLAPLLAGFGCNAVAVLQSRTCGASSRGACVSGVALGASCSYQTGAAISVFGAAAAPHLGLAFFALLTLVNAAHLRLWRKRERTKRRLTLVTRTLIQAPTLAAVGGALRSSVRQFLGQAMPVFLAICLGAAVLDHVGALRSVERAFEPLARALGLPAAVAPAVVLSMLRKDGILLLNAADAPRLSHLDLLGCVFLASTLAACSVTLLTMARELGMRTAAAIAAKQALTALIATRALLWLGGSP